MFRHLYIRHHQACKRKDIYIYIHSGMDYTSDGQTFLGGGQRKNFRWANVNY
jgi:hypothetical protein